MAAIPVTFEAINYDSEIEDKDLADVQYLLDVRDETCSDDTLACPAGTPLPACRAQFVNDTLESPQSVRESNASNDALPPSFEQSEPGVAKDGRSPLERFRNLPKKPLSVTDMTSPSWCEWQYELNLTHYGRIKRTAAMKRGSEIHKEIEQEIQTSVPVEVLTREDAWGLKLWNCIQGLRALRTAGITRELQVWGILHGEVVNGIIDELSFTCTDPDLERQIEDAASRDEVVSVSEGMTLSQYFAGRMKEPNSLPKESQRSNKIYITDLKTRGSPRLPITSAMKPTHVQLMLYRTLLGSLANGEVNGQIVMNRYRLNQDEPFSEIMISQISSIDFDDTPGNNTLQELKDNNSLHQMWQLMLAEYRQTFSGLDSISKVLKVEFRSSSNGAILGVRTFAHNDDMIKSYIDDEMCWWRGERPTRGVSVDEAYKCRSCAFSETCEWRLNKIQAAIDASRTRSGRHVV